MGKYKEMLQFNNGNEHDLKIREEALTNDTKERDIFILQFAVQFRQAYRNKGGWGARDFFYHHLWNIPLSQWEDFLTFIKDDIIANNQGKGSNLFARCPLALEKLKELCHKEKANLGSHIKMASAFAEMLAGLDWANIERHIKAYKHGENEAKKIDKSISEYLRRKGLAIPKDVEEFIEWHYRPFFAMELHDSTETETQTAPTDEDYVKFCQEKGKKLDSLLKPDQRKARQPTFLEIWKNDKDRINTFEAICKREGWIDGNGKWKPQYKKEFKKAVAFLISKSYIKHSNRTDLANTFIQRYGEILSARDFGNDRLDFSKYDLTEQEEIKGIFA